jgi:DNA-binding CsgD family transcriptional regulator
MDNKSIAELKIILNLSPENIKVKLFRTRKKLYVLINNQQL